MEKETEKNQKRDGIRILLVRHGETEYNLTHRFQGRVDIPLSKEGRNQAHALALALNEESLTAVYTSPLMRAMETAKIIMEFHPTTPLFVEKDLIEMDLGELEGKEANEWVSQHQEFYKIWRSNPSNLKMPGGGESLGEVQIRVLKALERITLPYPSGSTLLLSSHNFVNRAIICHGLGLSLDRFRDFQQEAAALNVLYKREGKLSVERVSESGHIKKWGVRSSE